MTRLDLTTLAVAGAQLLAFVFIPELLATSRLRNASPRLLAAGHLVGLISWSFVPAVSLACAGLGLTVPTSRSGANGCGAHCGNPLGAPMRPWQLVCLGVVLSVLAPLAWQGLRAMIGARHSELRGRALAGAYPYRLRSGGLVWVLPAAEPLAYAGGLVRPRAVVTTGLLDLLTPVEREAVLEHEAAHVRLGHPRLLLFGAAVARAYRFLPPVRSAWAGLRRELEAAADDEAARRVGADPMLCALARVGLARMTTSPEVAAFGDPDHLRYRIHRLQRPSREPSVGSNIGVSMLAGALAAALNWCLCTITASRPSPSGLLLCLGLFALVATRPLWTPRRRRPSVPPTP